MEIYAQWSSMQWEVINLEVILWRLSLIVQGMVLPSHSSHLFSISFVSGLLSRGLTLESDPFTLVDQFARDNVGNYVLQSILKRLHREMMCILTFQSNKLMFSVESPEERELNHHTALMMVGSFSSYFT